MTAALEVELVTIGNEILLGETIDTNSAYVGRTLSAIGARVTRTTVVGDHPHRLRQVMREVHDRSRWAITMGGLGPTRDDITRDIVAEVFDRPLVEDPALLEEVREKFRRYGYAKMPESNRSQAMVPQGAGVMDNPHGTAPGLVLEDDRSTFFVLPGVPQEMKAMLDSWVLPILAEAAGEDAPVLKSVIIHTAGIGESALAEELDEIVARADPVEIAFLPRLGQVDVRLTASGLPADDADQKLEALSGEICRRVERWVYGTNGATLATAVGDALRRRGWTIAVAESCTGGELGAWLTEVAGSSDYFIGGVIAYANDVKEAQLGVPTQVLIEHGAVSEEACRAMVDGVRSRLSADVGCAITGIAGPAGGTEEKPVGLVYCGVGTPEGTHVRQLDYPGSREAIRHRASVTSMAMVLAALRQHQTANEIS